MSLSVFISTIKHAERVLRAYASNIAFITELESGNLQFIKDETPGGFSRYISGDCYGITLYDRPSGRDDPYIMFQIESSKIGVYLSRESMNRIKRALDKNSRPV